MKGKKVKEATVDTRMLYKRLSEMNPGESVSYTDLSNIIGRNVQGDARFNLNTARKMVEREDSKTFGVIINEGVKCLEDKEIVITGGNAIDRIRRYSGRAARRFQCISDMGKLTNEEKIKLNANASILGAIAFIGRAKNIKKIEAAVMATQEQLPYAKTLDVFK